MLCALTEHWFGARKCKHSPLKQLGEDGLIFKDDWEEGPRMLFELIRFLLLIWSRISTQDQKSQVVLHTSILSHI